MKILILGARGRLAAALASGWGRDHRVTALARPELDAADSEGLRSLLQKHDFDLLVNGTGLTDVDRCESARDEARAVNALAPGIMAEAASKRGARLIHFSTDYVFDGAKAAPYIETDAANPLGFYGRTKLDGELAVLADDPGHLVVRVSWVFGPDKPAFIDVLIHRARTNPRIEAIADKISSPTHAVDVAVWLEPFFDPTLPGGIYHACNAGSCSWRDYGAFALRCASEAGVPLATTSVAPIRLADMKAFVAPRPPLTALSTEKLAAVTGIQPRSWEDAVRQYVQLKYAQVPPLP